MRAFISQELLCVYIDNGKTWIEVDYISLPRFTGPQCNYWSILPWQRDRLKESLDKAKEIVARFIADGRENATEQELKKAFNRL